LNGPNSLPRPFTFDVRGAGGFWAVEFDFECPEAAEYNFEREQFSMLVQARAFENGLVVMGMSGGAALDGSKGDTIIFSPPYNVTREEIEEIVNIFIQSTEDVLRQHKKH